MDALELTVLERLRKAMYETDGPEHLLEAAGDYGLAITLAQGDPGPLRGALERADADVSLIHDFLYGRGGTMDQAHAACWRIHDVLRPQIAALAASPPEPEPFDVERQT